MCPTKTFRFHVLGMDCADDAARVERAVRSVPGAASARVSIASCILEVPALQGLTDAQEVEAAVASVGYRIQHIDDSRADGGPSLPHQVPAYRRALWIVVALNLGYGIVEAVGGYLAGSQALKADALDFLGDGVITLLGLVAIGWSAGWRARAALFQGAFLGILGLGVLGNTIYRAVVPQLPDYVAMGALSAIALVVNVAAAAVLLPHRAGDANVRAVWLFSRNDAIGNVAVFGAAGLVAVLHSPWPDLVVGALVAVLFLHSSWAILASARADLRSASG